ncbi:hypothetical protein [Agrobacterium sp. LAD9]|uniref:hypothetical protein n=1 Tax=Agrobacterium sp. LAD9 TaxID=2055153 RepID=UPI0012905608|nr:hypothetical protein [Agrobacterium sp. LAD9]
MELKRDRGTITKVTLEVTYPDGSIKEAVLDVDNISALYFDEAAMDEDTKRHFSTSEDWKENPSFVGRSGPKIFNGCRISQCRVNWPG